MAPSLHLIICLLCLHISFIQSGHARTSNSTNDGIDPKSTAAAATIESICSIDTDTNPTKVGSQQQCTYIVHMTFGIPYSFSDVTDIEQTAFIFIIRSIINSILFPFAANRQSINTTVTVPSSSKYAVSSGRIAIKSVVGLLSDTLYMNMINEYNNNGISDDIVVDLLSAVNSEYTTSRFTIDSDITSSLTILNTPPPSTSVVAADTTPINDDHALHLMRFLRFDFAHYTLSDWIVLISSGLMIILCICVLCGCFCACAYFEKKRYRKIKNKFNKGDGRGSHRHVSQTSHMPEAITSKHIRLSINQCVFHYAYTPQPNTHMAVVDSATSNPPSNPEESTSIDRESKDVTLDGIIVGGMTVDGITVDGMEAEYKESTSYEEGMSPVMVGDEAENVLNGNDGENDLLDRLLTDRGMDPEALEKRDSMLAAVRKSGKSSLKKVVVDENELKLKKEKSGDPAIDAILNRRQFMGDNTDSDSGSAWDESDRE